MLGVFGTPERLSLPSSPEEGAALARRYRKRLWHTMFWGNIIAAIPGLLAASVSAGVDPDPVHAGQHLALFYTIVPVWLAVFGVGVHFTIRRSFRPLTDWLASTRAPASTERKAVGSVPRRLAVWSVYWWAAINVWNLPLNFTIYRASHVRLLIVVQSSIGNLAGGVSGAILTYLLAERALRPLVGLAAHGGTPEPSRVRVLQRLLLAFVAGVAAPLIGFLAGLIGLDARQRAGAFPLIWVTIAGVMVAGFVVAFVTARALIEPLDEVRSGFRRLREGDLEVEIVVNEPGEIGELQAGFNDLVSGLRDREHMRELFVRLVGKEVAQHALEHGSVPTRDVRQATAMFVDIIGSTPLAQSSSPQDYLATLNSFFDVVVREVEAAGGVVNQFQGDGALCIFGAPADQPDHAVRALRAARELRRKLDGFAQASGIEAVLGLSTGDVVAGHVGTSDRYEFTVVGDAVNEAKRLAEQAKMAESKVLVSEATIHAAEGEIGNWREATSVQLRGRSQATTTFTPRH